MRARRQEQHRSDVAAIDERSLTLREVELGLPLVEGDLDVLQLVLCSNSMRRSEHRKGDGKDDKDGKDSQDSRAGDGKDDKNNRKRTDSHQLYSLSLTM
eukprot:COSAG02_NODE_267_length_26570_cov_7.008235_4_plen_99_part_00